MPGVSDEAEVVAALAAQCEIGGGDGGPALHLRIAADQLDRTVELVGARPQIERHRLGIDRRFVFRSPNQLKALAVGPPAQHRARHRPSAPSRAIAYTPRSIQPPRQSVGAATAPTR